MRSALVSAPSGAALMVALQEEAARGLLLRQRLRQRL